VRRAPDRQGEVPSPRHNARVLSIDDGNRMVR
jgi:hypothetical protein